MKNERLLDAIGNIDSELIENAIREPKKRGMPRWAKWSSAIAACLCVAIGGVYLAAHLGGNAGPGSAAGNGGHDGGSVFMSYAGPVFPLTLEEENTAISAERRITLDFAPWIPVWVTNEAEAASRTELTEAERQEVLRNYNEWYPEGGCYHYSNDIQVTDSYLLTNSDARDQTVRILYPFASSLNDMNEDRPILTLNGDELETVLHAGSYAGGFEGAWENWEETHENPGSLNLDRFESWEGYCDLLADGTYLRRALGEYADLSGVPVTVYELTDAWGPERNKDAGITNPTIRVLFDLDYSQTKVLSYGFDQGLYDIEQGKMGKGFTIPQPGAAGYGTPYYLIVIGNDIGNMEYQGHATGGWDTEQTVESGVTITRTESNLEDALRTAVECQYQLDEKIRFGEAPDYAFELYFGLLKEHLMAYGILSENGAERYTGGMLEELDISGVDRVFWLEAEITVPAGTDVKLEAVFEKNASFDYDCAAEKKGISGYDLVTGLGSNLTFTGQTAMLEDRGQIEIVNQNFGFDPENGVTEVTLDETEPHYYLEIRRKLK